MGFFKLKPPIVATKPTPSFHEKLTETQKTYPHTLVNHSNLVGINFQYELTNQGLHEDKDYVIIQDSDKYSFGHTTYILFKDQQILDKMNAICEKRIQDYHVLTGSQEYITNNYERFKSTAKNKLRFSVSFMPKLNYYDKALQTVIDFYTENEYVLPESAAGFIGTYLDVDQIKRVIKVKVKDEAEAAQLSLMLKDIVDLADIN